MQAAGGAHPITARAPVRTLFSIAALAVAVDQATKIIAVDSLEPGQSVPVLDGVLHWTLQRNPGAAFSLFTRWPVLFTILAFVISAVIIVSARKVSGRLNAGALGLVLGGALGNLVDRVVRAPGAFQGHVIDFIDFRIWPVFNIADSCIVIGAILLVIASLKDEKRA